MLYKHYSFSSNLINTVGGQHHSSVLTKEEVKRSWDTVMKVHSLQGRTCMKQNKGLSSQGRLLSEGRLKTKSKKYPHKNSQKLHSQTSSVMFFWTSDSEAKTVVRVYHGSFNLFYAKAMHTIISFLLFWKQSFLVSESCHSPCVKWKAGGRILDKNYVFFDHVLSGHFST